MQNVHIYVEKGSCITYSNKERKLMAKEMVSHLKMLPIS